jgi:hypothetical protein
MDTLYALRREKSYFAFWTARGDKGKNLKRQRIKVEKEG